MQGNIVFGRVAEGLGALFARPVREFEMLYTGEEVGVVVGELRQEKRGQHRRSWKRTEANLEKPSSGLAAGSGVWGLGGEEDRAEGNLEPVDARSAGCTGCAGDTA